MWCKRKKGDGQRADYQSAAMGYLRGDLTYARVESLAFWRFMRDAYIRAAHIGCAIRLDCATFERCLVERPEDFE